MATIFSRNLGPRANPLTKFPLAVHAPGQATLASPNHTNIGGHPTVQSVIGPIAIGRPVTVSPIATRGAFK